MPPTSSATALPRSSARSATTTCAPSAASRRAASAPIPLAAPVMTATLPPRPRTRHPLRRSEIGGDEDVLDVGEAVQGVRAELPAEPGLLHPAERRAVPDRGVRVDRQGPGLDRPGHPDRPAHVVRPQ